MVQAAAVLARHHFDLLFIEDDPIIRVANVSCSSKGGLAIEKVRIFPSESVSGGIEQCKIRRLSGFEGETCGSSEVEGHGAFGDTIAAQQSSPKTR